MINFYISLSVFYGALFLIVGFHLPFFPVWLKSTKLEPFEISIILATPLFLRVLFTPFFSFLADKTGQYRLMVQMLAWGALCSSLVMFQVHGFLQILLISAIFSIFWTTIMPLTETIAMSAVRKQGLDYGRMRLWGSLTFILASFGGGYFISRFGDQSALWLFIFASGAVLLAAFNLPDKQKQNPADTPHNTVELKDTLGIIKSPVFLLFLIGASTIQASHAVLYSFGSIHWQSQGISETVIGVLWAIGVIAETVLFAFSGRVVAALGAVGLLYLGAIGGMLRWFIMAFDPSLTILFPLQILHALTFGAGHLGAVILIGDLVPERYSATAQGVYAAFSVGIVMGLATLITGPVYDVFFGKAYMLMAVLSFAALVCLALLARIWDGRHVTA